jgi:hypothetical protein
VVAPALTTVNSRLTEPMIAAAERSNKIYCRCRVASLSCNPVGRPVGNFPITACFVHYPVLGRSDATLSPLLAFGS